MSATTGGKVLVFASKVVGTLDDELDRRVQGPFRFSAI